MPWVLDANIPIDFAVADLLDVLFRLPLELHTTDILFAELKRPPGAILVGLGLQVYPLSGAQLLEVISLQQRYSRLSRSDLSAFVLARDTGAGLLTGDSRLRELAQAAGIEVHGTLWLLEALMTHRLLAAAQLSAALNAIQAAGGRLPLGEVKDLIRRRQRL